MVMGSIERGAKVFRVEDIPLVGCIAFGLIDRGTNLIQVRPTSTCPLSCVFCSTDSGPKSRGRLAEYVVSLDCLVEEFRRLASVKGGGVEAHIDTVGDPLTYPWIVELVSELRGVKGVDVVSMQTHGSLLNEKLLDDLSSAGLSRINLSIDAMDAELARRLSDTEWYDVKRVAELAKYIVDNTSIDLLVAPVWVPNLNDQEIPRIIEFALSIGAGKKWPPLGVQKYEAHKRGRKPRGARPLSWQKFYAELKEWEEEFKVKLRLSPEDFLIKKASSLPIPYKRFERVSVRVVGPGWLKGEKLAVTSRGDRVLTLVGADHIPVGASLKARILVNKHNIYVAEPV
ncbi:MAG: radical SAM protein [Candidatus Jordarchaeales archaeon]